MLLFGRLMGRWDANQMCQSLPGQALRLRLLHVRDLEIGKQLPGVYGIVESGRGQGGRLTRRAIQT